MLCSLGFFLKDQVSSLSKEKICKISGLVKSAIFYFYVKMKIHWGDYLLSMKPSMYMLETLYNMHVVAHIPRSHHMLLPYTYCHFSLEINLLKLDLHLCLLYVLYVMTRSQPMAVAEQGVSESPVTHHWLCWGQFPSSH